MAQSSAPRNSLQDYMQTYGQRLQSALGSIPAPTLATDVTDTTAVVGQSAQQQQPAPRSELAAPPRQPAAAVSELRDQTPMDGPQSQVRAAGGSPQQGTSFAKRWQDMSAKQQKQKVDELEPILSKAGETIDSAYDNMIQQLGTRPNGKLTREDKGMLLMEFGLSLMANSKRGVSLGEAVGQAGGQTLGRYQRLRRGQQRDFDTRTQAIEAKRAEAKSKLAQTGATESVRATSALAKNEADANRVAGTVTTDEGDLYSYNRSGKASALRDPQTGEVLQARDRHAADGDRGFQAQWRYDQYLKVHGVDEQGRPLTGAALQKVKSEALQYAQGRGGDSRTTHQKDTEDLIARGVPEDLAVKMVYHRIRDPRQAWQQLYATGIRSFKTEQEAAAEADDIIDRIYGPDAMQRTREPLVPPQSQLAAPGQNQPAAAPTEPTATGPNGEKLILRNGEWQRAQ